MLFGSFIMTPTVLVTVVDHELEVGLAFNVVEEETKETKEKSSSVVDDLFHTSYFLPSKPLTAIKGVNTFYDTILAHLHCPGEVAPPPEFS